MMAPGHGDLPLVKRVIDEAMRPAGIHILVLEVNDCPEFQSHPELRRAHGFSRADGPPPTPRRARPRTRRRYPAAATALGPPLTYPREDYIIV